MSKLKVPIELDHDGRYKQVVLFDDKSYVLQPYEGDLTIKGNTLSGRSNEGFVIDFIRRGIDHVLNKEVEKIKEDYDYLHEKIQLKMMKIDDVKKRQSLNMSIEEYRNKRASVDYNPIAQYEAALQANRPFMKGDVIETWIEEPEPVIREYKSRPNKEVIPKKSSYETIRLAKNYNGNIYRDHYLDRLEKGAKKFLVVLGWDGFQKVFPNINLNKPERRKMIPVWGLERFDKEFPEFTWALRDYNKLSTPDQELFKEKEKFKKYVEKFDI